VSPRREKKTFEFSPSEFDHVTGYLQKLVSAGQGWINLMPGIPEDAQRPEVASAGLFGLFGNRAAPVTMSTLMPARTERQATEGVTVGLMHPTGAKAVARLAEAGVTMPLDWLVRQDHARRGLVVRARPGAPPAEIVEWSIRAGIALCREEMTGEWQAVVYLP
jgi:hypothetical protein